MEPCEVEVCWKRILNHWFKMFYWQFSNLFASECRSHMILGTLFRLGCFRFCSFYIAWITPIAQLQNFSEARNPPETKDICNSDLQNSCTLKKNLHLRHLQLNNPSPCRFDTNAFMSLIHSHKIPSFFIPVCDHSRNAHSVVKWFIEKKCNNSCIRERYWIMHGK